MKYQFLGSIALAAAMATFMFAAAPSAHAADFTFSFDTNDVAFAYSDGYWDHDHHWHRWHNAREAHEYRNRYHEHYVAAKHTARKNKGWMGDADHDGVPNGMDDAPHNPHRQ